MPNLTINNGGIITNAKNLPNIDLRYGPYESLEEAYSALSDQITLGLVIGIKSGSDITEYIANDNNLFVPRSVSISYEDLDDLPKINNITLTGNKNTSDLGISYNDLNNKPTFKTINNESIIGSGDIEIEPHFKGWFDSLISLQTITPVIGDYGYVKGARDPVKIYECTTVGTWSDSGREFNSANDQSFGSGQQVNEVKIKDESGEEVTGNADVLSAAAGAILKGLIDLIDKSKGNIEINSEFTFIDGYFRNIKTRAVGASANWRYVRKELNKGDIFIAYNLNLGTANTCLACLVDSGGNFVEEVTYQNHWTYFVAEENCIIEWNQRNNETFVPIVYRDSSTDFVTSKALDTKDNKAWIDNKRTKLGVIYPSTLKWMRYATYNSQSNDFVNASNGSCACITKIPGDGINGISLRSTSDLVLSFTIKQYDADGNGVWYDVYEGNNVSAKLRFCKFFTFSVNTNGVDARTLVDTLTINLETDETAPVVYYGEPILPKLRWKHIGQTYPQTSRVQGGDAYNGILFQFLGQDRVDYFCGVYVIDLATGRKLQEIELGYEENTHNNTVCFGTQKYSEEDEFPLLYVSRYFSNPLQVYVYRVTVSNGVYSLTKVQTINVVLLYNYANFVIDKDSGFAYIQTLDRTEGVQEQVYYKFQVPDVSTVLPTLNYSDAIDTFRVSRKPLYGEEVDAGEQDCIIHERKLYASSGFSTGAFVNVIDLQRKKIVTSINLTLMIPKEVESVFFYGDKLFVGFNSSGEIIGIDFI